MKPLLKPTQICDSRNLLLLECPDAMTSNERTAARPLGTVNEKRRLKSSPSAWRSSSSSGCDGSGRLVLSRNTCTLFLSWSGGARGARFEVGRLDAEQLLEARHNVDELGPVGRMELPAVLDELRKLMRTLLGFVGHRRANVTRQEHLAEVDHAPKLVVQAELLERHLGRARRNLPTHDAEAVHVRAVVVLALSGNDLWCKPLSHHKGD